MPVYTGSRYVKGSVYGVSFDGQVKRILMRPNMLTEADVDNLDYLEYVVKEGDRFDTLAGKYGGSSSKWWIIAEVNGFADFPLDLVPGTKLKIPPQSFFEEN